MHVSPPRVVSPDQPAPRSFADAAAAVEHLVALYDSACDFLRERFESAMRDGDPGVRYRAFYPEIRLSTTTFAEVDSRLSFGHVAEPGTYATTVTRPDLFGNYLRQQLELLFENHGVPVVIGPSDTPIPIHFAVAQQPALGVPQEGAASFTLRDVFDVPDLATTNDDIVNGLAWSVGVRPAPLAPFTA